MHTLAKKLDDTLQAVLAKPDVREKLAGAGIDMDPQNSATLARAVSRPAAPSAAAPATVVSAAPATVVSVPAATAPTVGHRQVRIVDRVGNTWWSPVTVHGMSRTGAPLVARLHVDLGHVSSAVCLRG